MLKYSKITEGASIFIQDLFKEKVLLLLPKPEMGKGENGNCSDVPVIRSTVMQL